MSRLASCRCGGLLARCCGGLLARCSGEPVRVSICHCLVAIKAEGVEHID